MEDDYYKTRSIVELNKEIQDHRLAIARAAPGSKLVENVIADKDKLSSIVFRRKSPEQREQLCARRIIATRNQFNRKFDSVLKLEKALNTFIELEAQAARDKAAEEPNQERIARLLNEIDEAPMIIDRLPQAKKESVFSRLRAVQLLPASLASQERVASGTGPSVCISTHGRAAQEPKVHFEATRRC